MNRNQQLIPHLNRWLSEYLKLNLPGMLEGWIYSNYTQSGSI